MKIAPAFPWKRYALIAELARRLNGKSPQFGKTALQKLVFLLQEVYQIDCGYDFDLYSYGPFDAQLLSDLDMVESWGCVSVRSVNAGYEILPTDKVNSLHKRAAEFLDHPKTISALTSLVTDYGNMTARDLELRATTVYVAKDFLQRRKIPSMRELLKLVENIKPKFSKDEIEVAVAELRNNGHIKIADSVA